MDIFNFGVSVNKIVEEKMSRQEDIGYEYISDSVKWCDIEQCGGKIKGVNVWQVSKYPRYSNSEYIKKLGISMDFCLRYPKGLDPNDIESAFQFKNLSEIADNDSLLTKMRCFVSGKNYRGIKANDWWGCDIYKLKGNQKLNEDDLVKQAADVLLKVIGLLVPD